MLKKVMFYLGFLVLLTFLSLLGYVVYQASLQSSDKALAEISPQGRLPIDVEPQYYELSLKIEPEKHKLSGQVVINVDLASPKRVIWMHGKELDVSSAKIVDSSGVVHHLDYEEMGRTGVARLSSQSTINAGKATLRITYQANVQNGLTGIYGSEINGKHFVFSQFQPTDARRAFPSFDEPRFKTPFKVSLTVQENYRVLTNGRLLRSNSQSDGFVAHYFETTRPLPTYLLAFAVGDFDIVDYGSIKPSKHRKEAIPLRGIAVRGRGEQLTYALNHTEDMVIAMEEYFGTAYPYDKIDLVAVPDFAAGAMENAGLITYQERFLLLGNNPSIGQKRAFLSIHAHELAHQWLGNLVTMPWWNDLWLNESFATWTANKMVAQLYPELGFANEMVIAGHRVMTSDGRNHSRKLAEPITFNSEIVSAFDSITYDKGGAVLSMMEEYLGKEVFRQGINYHLNRFADDTATASDFFDSVSVMSKQPEVAAIFASFVNQNGVPLVSADYQCAKGQTVVRLRQQPYQLLGSEPMNRQLWTIPVCIGLVDESGERQSICTVLDKNQTEFTVTTRHCPVALMPNESGKGYYRWKLENEKAEQLVANFEHLTVGEKLSMSSNYFALFNAGQIELAQLIRILPLYSRSDNWNLVSAPAAPIKAMTGSILNASLSSVVMRDLKSAYQLTLSDIESLLLTENLDEKSRLHQLALLSTLVYQVGEDTLLEVLAKTARKHSGFLSDEPFDFDAVDPNLIGLSLFSGVEVYGLDFAKHLVTELPSIDDSSMRRRILRALLFSEREEVTQFVLRVPFGLSVNLSERLTILYNLSYQPANFALIFNVYERLYPIVNSFVPPEYLSYAPMIASTVCNQNDKARVSELFTEQITLPPAGIKRLNAIMEQIDNCIAMKAKFANDEGVN